MKKKLVLIFVFLTTILSAQSSTDIKSRINKIKSQPDKYYFGYAEGVQRKETDQQALQDLMSKIYVIVSSDFTSIDSESSTGSMKEEVKQVLNTYTYGRLPDVEQLFYKTGRKFHIFRYIEKAEYKKIFESKKTEIRGFLREADENLKLNQLGKSFRNFYRAAVAMEALPEASIVYAQKVYTPEIIFNLIRDIGEDIEVKLVSNTFEDNSRMIVLDLSYDNQPVNDLNIYYYDHHDFIPQKTNSNLIQIELYGEEYKRMKSLNLKIDMKEELYSGYSEQTQMLSSLFECEELEAYKEVKLKKKNVKQITDSVDPEVQSNLNIEFINDSGCSVIKTIHVNTEKLFKMLDYEYIDDETIFSDTKIIERMRKVVDNNHTKLLQYPQRVNINKTDFGWEARQFGVLVSCEGFPRRNETVVIDFDETGKVYNFAYTINPALHELFETRGVAAGDWDYRQIAIKFLENYKTSYTTKNIDDIETLYSDDAIIITGKVVKKTKVDKDLKTDFTDKEIIYFKRTKKEHIIHQKRIFAKNRFVWLQFDTFNISVAPVENVYGVSMKQNYYSSTYKDEGYLFLLIDFRGDEPLIHVRNWQPGEWDLEKQMTVENFKFY